MFFNIKKVYLCNDFVAMNDYKKFNNLIGKRLC